MREAAAIGSYQPVLVRSGPQGLNVRHLGKQIKSDGVHLIEIAEAALDYLLPKLG
jgi:hypothetical protein